VGLHITNDGFDDAYSAFEGSYSAFNRFRRAVAKCFGGSFPPHDDKSLDDKLFYHGDNFSKKKYPGLYEFMRHSDCDGKLGPTTCEKIANEMEEFLPKLESMGIGYSHMANYRIVAEKFIAATRKASEENKPLLFL